MTKYVDKEFGEAFSCDNIYLGKIKPTSNANQGFVTIEKYMEGGFTKYVNNNGHVTADKKDVKTQKVGFFLRNTYVTLIVKGPKRR